VDQLFRSGLTGGDITVLYPENENTREFAGRKGTRLPAGTAYCTTAPLPLDGTLGLRVPAEWCDRRVVHGKVLISVESSLEEAQRISAIMASAGAEDVDCVTFERPEAAPTLKGVGEKWPEIGSRNNGRG
jgi:hypothetical protein